MEQGTNLILFELLRSAVCGEPVSDDKKGDFSAEHIPQLYALSNKHDLAHIVGYALIQNRLIDEKNEYYGKFQRKQLQAIYRYEQSEYELQCISEIFEKENIPFIPLKGAVIRKYYPEPWFRTSCDIDILLYEKDVECAAQILMEQYDYAHHESGSHDISLFSPNNIHVELHFNLVENGFANEAFSVLKNIWDTTTLRNGFKLWHEMSDEMFYFYHIAHMAKHFENGGCGIRPFVDLWVLDNIRNADSDRRNKLLEQGKLLKFAKAVQKLNKVWFDNEEKDSVSRQMEAYIFCGGLYGNTENRIAIKQQKEGGRVKYIISRIFIPYDVIKFQYPILQDHRWLTPIMEVRRWFRLVFCGHAGQAIKEIEHDKDISRENENDIRLFLDNIGL